MQAPRYKSDLVLYGWYSHWLTTTKSRCQSDESQAVQKNVQDAHILSINDSSFQRALIVGQCWILIENGANVPSLSTL